jgi:hypothetical protein
MTPWDTLVRAVLLGTDREPIVAEELPEPIRARLTSTDEPARLLLDAAALLAGQRKASIQPVSGIKPIDPAPPDPRPLASPDAARRLARLLSGERSALLPEWLALAADRGLRVPPELLPALATAAANRTALRPAVTAAAGPRGPWLAAHTADWTFLADAPDHADESETTWRYGSTVARWAWLERARHTDPDGARAALAETWSHEPAEGRAMFLEALSVGLGPADEEFLEAALDDRSGEVRRLAAALLVRVPGARLGQRMADRLLGLVHIADDVVIELPGECDNAMRRDGVKQVPPAGTGSRAWWFRQIVAATPLSWWPGKPADVLRRPVTGPGGAAALHSALAAAAAEQRDPLWAQALLAVDLPATDAADLVAVLPTDRWAGAVFVLAATNGLASLVGLVLGLPTPWPADLGRLLLDELGGQPHLRNLAPIADAAARAVPPDCLRHPITERVAEPGVSAWHHRLVETLLFRRAMHEEFR